MGPIAREKPYASNKPRELTLLEQRRPGGFVPKRTVVFCCLTQCIS